LVAGPDAIGAERIGHQIDRLGGVAREDDLLRLFRVDEATDFLARALVGLGRSVGEIVQPAMHIGVFAGVSLLETVEHRTRFLCRCGIVEINQWLAVNLHRQGGEVGADAFDIVGAVDDRSGLLHRGLPGHWRESSHLTAAAVKMSRSPSCGTVSIASPTNAWISSASASGREMPRAVR